MYICMHEIMKTMCPPGYHHSGFVATHAHGRVIYGYILLIPMNQEMPALIPAMCPSAS